MRSYVVKKIFINSNSIIMLSTAFKNGFLMILIILIVHFLIKTYLHDNRRVSYQTVATEPLDTSSKMLEKSTLKTTMEPSPITTPTNLASDLVISKGGIPEVAPKTMASKEVDEDELFEYVFNNPQKDIGMCPIETAVDKDNMIKNTSTATSSTTSSIKSAATPSLEASNSALPNEPTSFMASNEVIEDSPMFKNIIGYDMQSSGFCQYEKLM
jgi:hypothetical protein